jgi:hypothetical protein
VDTDKSGQIDFSEFIALVYHMGTRYKEIRLHNHRNPRKGNKGNLQTTPASSTESQGPRRLSRAGEEYFAFLAEDRHRVQSEEKEKSVSLPGSSARGMTGGRAMGAGVGFSDLLQVGAGEGKSKEEEEEEEQQAPEVDSSSSGEDDMAPGMVAPAPVKQPQTP